MNWCILCSCPRSYNDAKKLWRYQCSCCTVPLRLAVCTGFHTKIWTIWHNRDFLVQHQLQKQPTHPPHPPLHTQHDPASSTKAPADDFNDVDYERGYDASPVDILTRAGEDPNIASEEAILEEADEDVIDTAPVPAIPCPATRVHPLPRHDILNKTYPLTTAEREFQWRSPCRQ